MIRCIRLIRLIRLDLQWRGRLHSYMWMDGLYGIIIGLRKPKSTFGVNYIMLYNNGNTKALYDNIISHYIKIDAKAKQLETELDLTAEKLGYVSLQVQIDLP